MQGLIEQNSNILKARAGFNAGAPITGPQRMQMAQSMSFANQLAQLKDESADQRDSSSVMSELAEAFPELNNTTNKEAKRTNSGILGGQDFGSAKSNEDQILKSLRREEFSRDQETLASSESQRHSNDQITEALSNSETVKAMVSQVRQAEGHDAVREGNVAEREAQHENGNDRKKQLANWEDLAPRITEDTKNRAVRIDIPGLGDIETLIVRMQKNQVIIQAVGNGAAMKSLQGREAELKAKLASKNIHMGSLQAFDANRVSTKRKVA